MNKFFIDCFKRYFFIVGIICCFSLMPLQIGHCQREVKARTPSLMNNSPGEADLKIDILDLKQVDILDVLKLISQKSGLNIVAEQNVRGKVTIYLRELEALEALKVIVDAYGWAFAQEEKIIKVMSASSYEKKYGHKFGEQVNRRLIPLQFANVSEVMTLLNQIKDSSTKIIVNEKSNTLILIDSDEKLDDLIEILKSIDVTTKTEVFQLNYAKAEDISGKVIEVLTPQIGSMNFDQRSNRIMVSDTEFKLKEIKSIIEAFDQKDQGVLIEAKILQIKLTDNHKMGIDWEAIVSDFHNMSLSSNFDVLGATEKRGQLQIGTLASDKYTALVEALDTVGETNILSRPRITTINNMEAKILVGLTEPYVTTTTTTPDSGPPITAETVNFIDVGVKLHVTPTVHNDGFISLNIRPEVSSVVDNLTTSNNNTIPIVETSEAETTVIVKNGVTIVIGGLIKEEKINSMKKIPLLGDIPLLGLAFRNKSDVLEKTEIVIFMTPTLFDGEHSVIEK